MVYEHTYVLLILDLMSSYVCMYIRVHMLLQKGDVLCFAAETDNVAETKRLIQSGVFVDSINEVSYKKVITMHGYFKRNNTRRKFLRI